MQPIRFTTTYTVYIYVARPLLSLCPCRNLTLLYNSMFANLCYFNADTPTVKPYLTYPARQTTQTGVIDSLESISGLFKRLKILALKE
jgi:hypothetical protein